MSRSEPWGRRPGESSEAYRAFLAYRDLEAGRSLEGARRALSKGASYLRLVERWSSRWGWVERAGAWDGHLQHERDRVASGRAADWERRRLESHEAAWEDAQMLQAKVRAILEMPIMVERVEDTAAGTVT